MSGPAPVLDHQLVSSALEALFIAAGPVRGRLRREDWQKATELLPLLREVDQACAESGRRPGLLVDAAAGKAPVGLLAAELLLARRRRPWTVVMLERDPDRVAACRRAAERRRSRIPVEVRLGDLADATLWPAQPDLVVGLHACGAASDAIIDRTVSVAARRLLLVPCCYGKGAKTDLDHRVGGVPTGQPLAQALAEPLGLPRHALVRRRFAQALIDSERTLRLEASGYQTEVVELFSPQISPFNLLWRARRVGEPARTAAAAACLKRLRHGEG